MQLAATLTGFTLDRVTRIVRHRYETELHHREAGAEGHRHGYMQY